MRGIGLGKKRRLLIAHPVCVCGALWEAHPERELGCVGCTGSRKAGGRDWSLSGSLRAGLARAPLLSHRVTLNEGST